MKSKVLAGAAALLLVMPGATYARRHGQVMEEDPVVEAASSSSARGSSFRCFPSSDDRGGGAAQRWYPVAAAAPYDCFLISVQTRTCADSLSDLWQGAGDGPFCLFGTHPMTAMPPVRGQLTPDRPLADLTWLRVGGPADWLFQPVDEADLAAFLATLDPHVAVFPMGVGSNLIVRDGGIRAVVIRLGRGFNSISVAGQRVTAGAAALDAHVARRAAEAGVDLTFLRTIPGAIGGAVRMNAGCYGSYVADHLVGATAVTRDGRWQLDAGELKSSLPAVRSARRLGHHLGHVRGRRRRPRRAGGADGRTDRPARREPADEGAQRRVHLPQSRRVFFDRPRRRYARTQGVEGDRRRGNARRAAGRRTDEREAFELPDQHGRRYGGRSGRFGRRGSMVSPTERIDAEWEIMRVGEPGLINKRNQGRNGPTTGAPSPGQRRNWRAGRAGQPPRLRC